MKRKKREASYRGGAWWFRGKGYEPIDVGASTHIALLIKSPEKFGLTQQEIEETHAKHDEFFGMEGQAREELIKKAVMKGWIRIRHYISPINYWSFTVDSFQERRRDLVDFCWWAITEGKMSEHDEIFISSYKDNRNYEYGFRQGGVKAYLNEKKKNRMLLDLINRYKS